MRHRNVTLVVAVLTLLAGNALVQAQSPATVSVDFKFVAGTMAMPAGKYVIDQTAGIEISIKEAGGGKAAVVLPVITILGRHDTDRFPELVFDIYPDGPHLSEVWFPRIDGFLVLATKEPHEHRVLQAK
jgi:hypothetical protein